MSSYSDVNEAKRELQEIVSNLNEAKNRLSGFIEKLPPRGQGDEMLTELRLAAREAKTIYSKTRSRSYKPRSILARWVRRSDGQRRS